MLEQALNTKVVVAIKAKRAGRNLFKGEFKRGDAGMAGSLLRESKAEFTSIFIELSALRQWRVKRPERFGQRCTTTLAGRHLKLARLAATLHCVAYVQKM